MINSIAKSKNASEKRKMEYKNLKFFVLNSLNRVQRVRSGTRLANVIKVQAAENQKVSSRIPKALLCFSLSRSSRSTWEWSEVR